MIIRINNEYELKEKFREYNRDYYSLEACRAILDFEDELNENTELDVIALCGTYTESDVSDLLNDYDYLLSVAEWAEDNDIALESGDYDELSDDDKEAYLQELCDAINARAFVTRLINGRYLVME